MTRVLSSFDMRSNRKPRTEYRVLRRGLTLMEVMFATMVVVVGLLGIASILPMAARDAEEATAHTHALSLGTGWADSFFARGLYRPNPNPSRGQLSWLWYRDYRGNSNITQSNAPGWENFIRQGYASDSQVQDRLRVNSSIWPFDSRSFSSNATDGTGESRRIWGHQPVCLDPYAMVSDSMTTRIANGQTALGGFRASVFPYFNDQYDPAIDPFISPSLDEDRPRMLRVGLASGQDTPTFNSVPYTRGRPCTKSLVASIFGSVDGMVVDDSEDLTAAERNSLPRSRYFAKDDGNGALLKALTDGTYTWLATVVPMEPLVSDVVPPGKGDQYVRRTGDDCLVSFVVLNRHSHEYVSTNWTDQNINNAVGNTEAQPTGERVTRVYPLSGNFVGGTGGRVRLVASSSVRDNLKVGDWLMLGRYYLFDLKDNPSDNPNRPYAYFRWYRVIGLSQETVHGPLGAQIVSGWQWPKDNQVVNTPVWSRDVVLEGPDFEFGPAPQVSSGPSYAPATPTQATLVSGVVTVIERQVKLKD